MIVFLFIFSLFASDEIIKDVAKITKLNLLRGDGHINGRDFNMWVLKSKKKSKDIFEELSAIEKYHIYKVGEQIYITDKKSGSSAVFTLNDIDKNTLIFASSPGPLFTVSKESNPIISTTLGSKKKELEIVPKQQIKYVFNGFKTFTGKYKSDLKPYEVKKIIEGVLKKQKMTALHDETKENTLNNLQYMNDQGLVKVQLSEKGLIFTSTEIDIIETGKAGN